MSIVSIALSALAALAAEPHADIPPNNPVFPGYWTCEVRLQLHGGTLRATRRRMDRGVPFEEDSATWTAEPSRFELSEFISWESRENKTVRLSNLIGEYKVYVRSKRKLPRITEWRFEAGSLGIFTPLRTIVETGYDKRMGAMSIPLTSLLAYAGGEDELKWSVSETADTYRIKPPFASGNLNVVRLRAAAAAIATAEAELDRLSKNPTGNCQLEHISDSPDAEI